MILAQYRFSSFITVCFFGIALVFSTACALAEEQSARADRPPNVVFILSDNHGAWTLGCYGNKDIRTPNLDKLAAEGTLFERSYCSNPVCSPTRATYLTGLMPSQHGVHSYLGREGAQMGPNAYCTIEEFRSLPEILAARGYQCGLVGKWHLGDSLRPQEGFTTWLTMPMGGTTTFHDADVIENGAVRKEPTYLTEFWTNHAVEFINTHKDQPFFLYLPYNGPYGLGPHLLNPARNRHREYYADKELPSFPREEPHPWLFNNRDYINNPVSIRRYAAEVSGVDDGVGRVMQALKENGLDDDTLVIFAGDQGLAGGHNGFWGMGDHTRPITGYDWTMHVPLIWRHPGKIAAGHRSELLVSNYDFLPSILDYLGIPAEQVSNPVSPGRSYRAALQGESPEWENSVFYEYETVRAIRTDDWKYIERFEGGPNELFDLRKDPGERNNLIDQPNLAETQKKLAGQLQRFFDKYVDPQYDLWNGGVSKAHRIVPPEKMP